MSAPNPTPSPEVIAAVASVLDTIACQLLNLRELGRALDDGAAPFTTAIDCIAERCVQQLDCCVNALAGKPDDPIERFDPAATVRNEITRQGRVRS